MTRGTQLEIRPHALIHNAQRACHLAGAASVFAMVKANAYGHGLHLVADILREHVDGYGVAVIEEAVALRELGIDAPIMLLEGCFDAGEWRLAEQLQLDVVVHSEWQLNTLDAAHIEGPISMWLKVDTGMHRIGVPEANVEKVLRSLQENQCIHVAGLMTHFACADMADDNTSESQLKKIRTLAEKFSLPYSAANSAALFQYPESSGARVRPGIMLYGSSPVAGKSAEQLMLQVTQRLTASVIAINDVPAGESVGYGATWTAQRDSKIGVVAIGYGDGYPRHAANGAPVAINGQRANTVGRVSMDMITIDLTDIQNAQVGDVVELWGDSVTIDEVAKFCGTISYELFCQITTRPHRVIADGQA